MHTLTKLTYPYSALEPHIDARTMEVHHTKHHQKYTDKLNAALDKHPDLQSRSIVDLLSNLGSVPEEIRTAVRNHGGGYFNHNLFFTIMGPGKGGQPTGELSDRLEGKFGGFDAFKEAFATTALGQFGSGWAWLSVDRHGKLHLDATPNQDSPLMVGREPLLGIDVWEHAYYLKYQNRRADYIDAWWNVVDWENVAGIFANAKVLASVK